MATKIGASMQDDFTKRCNVCGEEKPLSEYNRLSQSADGYDYRCRECQQERWRLHYERSGRALAHEQAIRDRIAAGEKACTKCGIVKLFLEFHQDKRKRDGLFSWCKVCFREHVNTKNRKERQTNPGPLRERWMRYHARKRDTQIDSVDYDAILLEHGMMCHICGTGIAAKNSLHFDHVIPLSRGGAHVENNIRPAHAVCNISKGSKLLEELTNGQRLF